ncbi:MAG: hypothetical protein FJ220_05010, partial [Kiritimatiellaceae bacterium]|nr:hypothetical protein [Kiritimatiellaceae bacterium]
MKPNISIFKIALLAAGLFLATQHAHAIEWIERDQFTSGTAETLRDETWISAIGITLSGEALDDLFALGTTIELRGKFNGDVWACGETIMASGQFNDHVRLLATTAQVAGKLDGSLLAMGKTVKIDPTAEITKNVLCIGEVIIIEGSMAGQVKIIAQKATLGGSITGDVSIAAQDIVILPNTVIHGNLTYTAPKELFLSPSVTLHGKLDRIFEKIPPRQWIKENLVGHYFLAFAAFLTGLAFNSLFFIYSTTAAQLLTTRRLSCLSIGLAALLA